MQYSLSTLVLFCLCVASSGAAECPNAVSPVCADPQARSFELGGGAGFACISIPEVASVSASTEHESIACTATVDGAPAGFAVDASVDTSNVYSSCRVVTDATSKITSFELRDSSNNPGSFVSYGLRAAGVSEVLDDSPVAYWRLGGPDALLDQSGNGHTLSEVGSAGAPIALNQPSVFGAEADADTAVAFSGTGQNQQMGANTFPDARRLHTSVGFPKAAADGAFSIEAWVSGIVSEATQPDLDPIVSDRDIGSNRFNQSFVVMLYVGNIDGTAGRVRAHFSATMKIDSVGTIDDGLRHHIVATYNPDTDTRTLYIDGVVDTEIVQTLRPVLLTGNENSVSIGADDAEGQLNGVVDEVAIYDKPLSAARVLRHFEASVDPTAISSACGTGDLLVAKVDATGDTDSHTLFVAESIFTDGATAPTCAASTAPCGDGQYSVVASDGGEELAFCFAFGDGSKLTADISGSCDVAVTQLSGSAVANLGQFTRSYADCTVTLDGDDIQSFTLIDTTSGFLHVDFAECSKLVFSDTMRKRQAGNVFSASAVASSGTFGVLASGANGDPHLIGAHGEHYDFFGMPGAVYNLFSTPQFVLNMQLWDKGPLDRYIERLGVVFRNTSHIFSTAAFHPRKFEQKLNRELGPAGGKASLSPNQINLELCDGHRVSIVHRVARAQKHAGDIYHLDVAVTVPGCHDSYGGALGQTYQCRYAKGERFVWSQSHKLEETFRVKSLTAKSGAFSRDAPCHDVAKVFAGQSPMSGRSGNGGRD